MLIMRILILGGNTKVFLKFPLKIKRGKGSYEAQRLILRGDVDGENRCLEGG